MDIEKTYELMNELEIFKELLKEVNTLEVKRNEHAYRHYIRIFVNIMDQIDYKKRDLIVENIKNCLRPSLETKIKELEEEIRDQK